MKKSKKNQKIYKNSGRIMISRVMIFSGIIMIAIVGIIQISDYIAGKNDLKDFEKQKVKAETIVERTIQIQGETVEISYPVEEPTAEVGGSVLAVLRIPKIDLEEAVKEGSDNHVISSALGHMEQTALPGEEGNCAIAGHRNYVFGRFFNRLDEVQADDEIEIETLDGTYTYRVTDSFVVEPEDVSVIEQLEGKNLTLITCTPIFVGSHRLIISAVLE